GGITMATGLELYEALKPAVGEEAAKMIAEALPMNEVVATKGDIDSLRAATKEDIESLRAGTKSDLEHFAERIMAQVDAKIAGAESRIYQRMLTFNITLFLGLAGMIVAIVL